MQALNYFSIRVERKNKRELCCYSDMGYFHSRLKKELMDSFTGMNSAAQLLEALDSIYYQGFHGFLEGDSLEQLESFDGVTLVQIMEWNKIEGYDTYMQTVLPFAINQNALLPLYEGFYRFDSQIISEIRFENKWSSVQEYCDTVSRLERLYSEKEIEIPYGVRSIPKYFFSFSGVKSVVCPEWVEAIEEGAFYGCDKLEAIQLPKKLKAIGQKAFSKCVKLKAIEIPEGTKVAKNAFDQPKEKKEERRYTDVYKAIAEIDSLKPAVFFFRSMWDGDKYSSFIRNCVRIFNIESNIDLQTSDRIPIETQGKCLTAVIGSGHAEEIRASIDQLTSKTLIKTLETRFEISRRLLRGLSESEIKKELGCTNNEIYYCKHWVLIESEPQYLIIKKYS